MFTLIPQSQSNIYSCFFFFYKAEEAVFTSDANTNVFRVGDFNLPDTNWCDTIICLSSTYLTSFLQFQQINPVLNLNSVLLDLEFTNSTGTVSSSIEILFPLENYHLALRNSGDSAPNVDNYFERFYDFTCCI